MTNTKADGTYDVGSDFIYKKELDEKGEWVKSNEPDEDIVKEHFLKPKHVLWQSNPHLKRSVLSVAIGVSHLVVAARDPGEMHAHVYTSGGNGYGQLGHGDVGSGAEHQRHALTLVCNIEICLDVRSHFCLTSIGFSILLRTTGRGIAG